MATKFTIDGYDSYSGADIVVVAQLSNINGNSDISKKCYTLGSLQTISISTFQDKAPVRALGNINALDYVMGPRSIAGSLVFAVFDRHFAYEIFNDLKKYTGTSVLLTDEIPPLDLTLCFQNEYGKRSRMTLYGVKMVSEGQVMSVNDLFTENTYQFVGTGLENLTPEDGNYPSINPTSSKTDPVISPTNTPFEKPDNISTGSKYNYRDSGKPGDDGGKKGEVKSVDINQPLTDDDYGQIIIGLNNPSAINAYLTSRYDDQYEEYLNANRFNNTNRWAVSVPEGTYNLVCYDNTTGEQIGDYDNLVVRYQDKKENINDYPIINYVSNSTIEAEINNPEHDELNLMCDRTLVDKQKVKKNTCIFQNLTPSTEYKIYSSSSKDEEDISKTSLCNTLESKYETENDFKNFVFSNKDLWVNDLSTINFESFNTSDASNLIDKILNMNCEYKDELLLYAIIYQNDFLKCANSENDINLIYNDSILNPYFSAKNSYKDLIFYYLNDKDFYYGDTKSYEDYNFRLGYDEKNKRYYVYALDKDNTKSLKYDFYNYDVLEKEELQKYKKEELNINDYDYKNYKNKYPAMSEELLETIIYKDYNMPKYSIFEAPKVSYDSRKEELYVKLYSRELMDRNAKYYLCIRKKSDAFQNTPVMKIEITNSMDELILNKYKTHILKNNYYLIYIEDKDNNIVSKTSIVSSYTDTSELDEYNYNSLKEKLLQIRNSLLEKYSCKDLIDSIYLSVLSYDLKTKDTLEVFLQELLNEGLDSLQYSSLDEIFYDIYVKTYNSSVSINEKYEYKDGMFGFENFNLNTIVLDFYIDEENPVKQTNISEVPYIDLNNRTSYYTIIYGVNKNTKMKTGFFLKNNINNKVYSYKLDKVEVSN